MSIVRKTKTVELLLKTFNKSNGAISVVELVSRFSKEMNKTTVYRILDRLEESGILHSFTDQDGLKRYAKGQQNNKDSNNLNMHPHFLCQDCGISSCLPIDISIPPIPDYKIQSSEHLLIGQCKDCLA
jgi:Fur family ferric uptake transcriptional regulator|tara:strand:+ start:695 stop:1078 length:384 start_codon:yes stop_codon:yes gene_type:complete